MDRRQRKTREAIFRAFTDLLELKSFAKITVGEIINRADVGRATFYAHFETKDQLMQEFCQELFCHIFDATSDGECGHRHIFSCDAPDSVFLHLLQHIQRNDNNILVLLSAQHNELFWQYFQNDLTRLVESQLSLFATRKSRELPEQLWKNHIVSAFLDTLKWWIDSGMQESPETIVGYFLQIV